MSERLHFNFFEFFSSSRSLGGMDGCESDLKKTVQILTFCMPISEKRKKMDLIFFLEKKQHLIFCDFVIRLNELGLQGIKKVFPLHGKWSRLDLTD